MSLQTSEQYTSVTCRDTYCRLTCQPFNGASTNSSVTQRTDDGALLVFGSTCDLTCMTSQMEWKHWQQGVCVCRQFRDTPGHCPGGRGSVPPLHNGPPAEAHWGPLMWGGDEWDEWLCKTKTENTWQRCATLELRGQSQRGPPLLDVLQHLVCSLSLIQPRVSAVPHQLAPLYPPLH